MGLGSRPTTGSGELRGQPKALAEMFLDERMGTAHPDCERYAQTLARTTLSLMKSEAEWKRKAARRSEHIGDLLDKLGNYKYELRQLEQMLAWVVRTEVPLEEIRHVVANRIPQRLEREPDLGYINPEPLDQAAIDGLMTKRPYLRWYEFRAFVQWRRARRRWRKERGLA